MKYSNPAFIWSVEDVNAQLLGIIDSIGEPIELDHDDKEEILAEAIEICEDEIITIINIEIQNAILRIYEERKKQK